MGKTKQKQDRSHYLFSNRELANLIGPLVIEQLLAVFVGMADSIMVANVGEAAVSGVSLVDNIMILIINIFAALATGGAVVAGQYIGRKDEKSACKAATQLVWFVSLSAVAIMILVYFGKDIILNHPHNAQSAVLISLFSETPTVVLAPVPDTSQICIP